MKKIKITILILMIGSKLYSQSLYLNFKPAYSFAFGTWKEKIIFQNSDNYSIHTNSRFGNIAFGYRAFCGSLDIIRYKKFTFGLDYFKSSAIGGHNVKYIVKPPVSNPNLLHGTANSSNEVFSTNIFQFGIHSAYNLRENNLLSHQLTIGAFLQLDKTSYDPIKYSTSFLIDGSYNEKYYYDTTLANKKSFCLQFRYDLHFKTKKQKNIFSIFVLYQQGFREMAIKNNEFYHSKGYDLRLKETSKSSGIYVGICKPILFFDAAKKTKNEN